MSKAGKRLIAAATELAGRFNPYDQTLHQKIYDIPVSKAMAEAGCIWLSAYEPGSSDPIEIVTEVYRIMEQTRRDEADGGG